uniref:BZIP domain-containing protein n=3 Tax=Clastoptera arizonana TaxID=38151 RepID=A0A1B6DPB8_9HEMI
MTTEEINQIMDKCVTSPPSWKYTSLEDMELIEVLWKQDVDMGFTMSSFQELPKVEKVTIKPNLELDAKPGSSVGELLEEKLDELDPWEGLSYTVDMETGEYVLKKDLDGTELSLDEPPSSLLQQPNYSLEEAFQLVRLNEDNFELSDSLDINNEVGEGASEEKESEAAASASSEEDLSPFDSEDPLDLLNDMIQTPQFHARPFQGRMPYVRTMSMEQRWQDLANLLSLPDPNHHHHPYHHFHGPTSYPGSANSHHGGYHSTDSSRSVLLHNATLAPPMGDLNSSIPYPSIGGSSNLGSAVATSMNLTNSSEPMGSEHQSVNFKMETPHDMMYYQNGTSEMNHTTEGFLSSILNDEDLQLMDIAVNEGLYSMRPMDGQEGGGMAPSSGTTSLHNGITERGTDSDSAVSSMGSERVPSLSSDTEWMETNSDSGHTPTDHYADYQGKFRWYDYNYPARQHSVDASSNLTGSSRMPLVAQKKHHMYGKRYFQEQVNGGQTNTNSLLLQGTYGPPSTSVKFELPGMSESNSFPPTAHDAISKGSSEMKYSCSVEFSRQQLQMGIRPPLEHVNHNHTYHMPPEQTGAMQRPITRDKKGRKSEEEHLTRDEKRARSLNIPISVSDIINLPMDEFNERLSKYDLSESQLSLIRDIRRRGKNKVAAQNCRKRKLDQILSLADEVKQMRDRKIRLDREREFLIAERQRIKNKFSQLYRHIFQALRDSEGNPYSPYEWSLQQSADGSVILVPKSNSSSMFDSTEPRSKHKDPDSRPQSRKP